MWALSARSCRRCCHCCCTCFTVPQGTQPQPPTSCFFFSAPCQPFWLLGRRRLCKSEAQLSSAPECRTIKQLKVDKNKLQQPREPWQKERGIVARKERALTIHKVQLHKSETSPQCRATRAPNNDNCNCSRSEREGNVGKGKRRH